MKNRIQKIALSVFFLTGFLFLVSSGDLSAQDKPKKSKKVEKLTIHSSMMCGMCEDKVSGLVGEIDGVKAHKVNLNKNTVWVKYNTSKTSADAIRTVISKAGFDADGVKADPDAYQKLPACCKKPS